MKGSITPEQEQKIITRYIYGDSVAEIAKDLRIGPGTLQARIDRIKGGLAKREIAAIRNLTVALKKNRIPVATVISAARTSKTHPKKAGDELSKDALVVRRRKELAALQMRADLLTVEMGKLKETNSYLKKEVAGNQKVLDGQKILVREAQLLIRSGFDAVDISRIRVKMDEIAEKRSLDVNAARKAFIEDLDSYDAMIGFKGRLDSIKSDEDERVRRMAELDKRVKDLELQYNRKKTVLDALSHLLEKGIEESEIQQLKTFLESSGMNIGDLKEQLKEHGGLVKKTQSLRKEERQIEEQISKLRGELKELSDNRAQLQSSVTKLNSEILSRMEEIGGKADAVVDEAKKKIGTISEELKKGVEEATDLSEAGQKLENLMEELKKRVEETSKEIIEIADSSAKEVLGKEAEAASILSKRAVQSMDAVHKQALLACKKYLGRVYETAPTDKKIEYITHYENILALLRKPKSK